MSADKIQENWNGNKNQNKTLEAVFKEAHDYLENLEKNIAKLLKKFHLNSGSFDGDIDKKTTWNHIEEVYQKQILKLKDGLESHNRTMNKQMLVSQLIAMTMSARWLEMSELSKIAKEKLKWPELAEFEKEKLKLLNNNDLKETLADIKDASNKIDESEWKKEEKEIKEKQNKALEKVKNATKDLNNKKINLSDWEIIINAAQKNSWNTEAFAKELWKYLEWTMISWTVPVAMITLQKWMWTLKVLPSIIWLNI